MHPPRDADYDRYLCSLFAPKEVRASLWAAITFGHEIMRIPNISSEEMVGLVRLKWWQEEIQRLNAAEYVPSTPLLAQLATLWKNNPAAIKAASHLCDIIAEHGFAQPSHTDHITAIMQAYFSLLCITTHEEAYKEDYIWLAEIVAQLAWHKTHATDAPLPETLSTLWQARSIHPTHPRYIRHLWLLTRRQLRSLQKYHNHHRLSTQPWRLWWDSFTFSLQKP
jgi:hypothetical protein